MIPSIDLYSSAKLLIEQHGEDATTHAAMQADATLAMGDLDGKRACVRINAAIEETHGTRPSENAH